MITNNELCEFEQSLFTGVTVGIGSIILLFSSGGRVLIQCPFECEQKEHSHMGHGEAVLTSSFLFSFLNKKVELCGFLNDETLKISFGCEGCIYIYPERNGLESYVITTSQGDYPIVVY
ncbi:hypothetical protein [Pantoea ananatis]|uniref:hypothetical protein n=1 Tax=Pantoea ananas TaxID=553 RepID=UPI001907C556|nr:hypothetical protein [Pantoea ananatis]